MANQARKVVFAVALFCLGIGVGKVTKYPITVAPEAIVGPERAFTEVTSKRALELLSRGTPMPLSGMQLPVRQKGAVIMTNAGPQFSRWLDMPGIWKGDIDLRDSGVSDINFPLQVTGSVYLGDLELEPFGIPSVNGELKLMAVQTVWAHCNHATLGAVSARGAEIQVLKMTNSTMSSLSIVDCRIGDLDIRGSTIDGVIDLSGSSIGRIVVSQTQYQDVSFRQRLRDAGPTAPIIVHPNESNEAAPS